MAQRITDWIPVGDIDAAGSFQPRIETSMERAEHYGGLRLKDFPPADVFGKKGRAPFWIGDGFTRYEGALVAGLERLYCTVHEGDARSAKLFALGSNTQHGYPRTNSDKRRAVVAMFADPVWGNPVVCPECRWMATVKEKVGYCMKCRARLWTDHRLAEHCAASQAFVSSLRREYVAGLLDENGAMRRVVGAREAEGADQWWVKTEGMIGRLLKRVDARASDETRRLWGVAQAALMRDLKANK